jgi:intracellular sulfur oxidation DsrE/DsrF family protein
MSPGRGSTPRQINWLTVCRNVTLTGISKNNYVEEPITVVARSKALIAFVRSNTGVVGSNPAQGMDVCVCDFSVFVLLCV